MALRCRVAAKQASSHGILITTKLSQFCVAPWNSKVECLEDIVQTVSLGGIVLEVRIRFLSLGRVVLEVCVGLVPLGRVVLKVGVDVVRHSDGLVYN